MITGLIIIVESCGPYLRGVPVSAVNSDIADIPLSYFVVKGHSKKDLD